MPDWKPELRRRLADLRVHPARQMEIVDELVTHLDERYEELRAEGMSETDAARVTLGEIDAHELFAAEMRPLRQSQTAEPIAPGVALPPARGVAGFAGDLRRDVVYALRMLRRTPGFTIVAVLTLGLGIGVTSAVFSLVNATLLAKLPVANVDQLVYVGNGSSPAAVFNYPNYVDLRDRNEVFSDLVAWGGITASLNADERTDTVNGAIVTGNFFATLGVSTALGRPLSPLDDQAPGAHPVVVISDGLWRRRFGGRSDIIGHAIVVNGRSFTIAGVTAPGFHGPQVGVRRDIYVPMMMQAVVRPPRAGYSGEMNPDLLQSRRNQWLFAIGRLRNGTSLEQAQASLSVLQLALDPPDRPRPQDPNRRITVQSVAAGPPEQREQLVSVALLLGAIVCGVLLIACANVANLLLSRAVARQREIAVRLAIGAGQGRLVRQLLTESVALAIAGGALGVLMAYGIVQVFLAWPPPAGALPLVLEFAVDARVLVFTFGVSLLTGLLFGLAPALRTARPELVPSLKDESFVPDEHARRFNMKNGLIVAQVAISLALLIGSALFVRSLYEAQKIDSGYVVDRLTTLDLPVNLLRYTRTQSQDFYRRAIETATALPGVEAAAVARVAVLTGAGRVTSLHLEGRGGSDAQFSSENSGTSADRESVNVNVVSAEYFQTMGLTMKSGRDFGAADTATATPVAVVNETFARIHLADGPRLGQRLSLGGRTGPWVDIVGVVSDGKYADISEAPRPIVYVPLSQNHETGVTLYVRTAGSPALLTGALARAIQALEPNLPLDEPNAMTDVVGTSLYLARVAAWLIGALGMLALVLASIGLYGVLAFAVSRRTREIGIRSALGANTSTLFRLIIGEGMTLVGIGVAIGLTLAWYSSDLIATFLVGVHPTEPVTYAAVVAVLSIVALFACAIPARRATKIDPLVALRQQ